MKSIFICLFFLVLSSSHAQSHSSSGLSLEELNSLSQKLESFTLFNEIRCNENTSDNLATSLFATFLFDGSLGYCPRYFWMNQPQKDLPTLMEQLEQTIQTSENSAVIQKILTFMKNETQTQNCHLIKTVLKASPKTTLPLFYYSKQGESEAAQCAQKVIKNNPKLKINVLAYSMGSETTLHFAEKLGQQNITLDQILTIDPVARNIGSLSSVIATRDNPLFKLPASVVYWNNFHQHEDDSCLVNTPNLHLGIRGNPIQGTDQNRFHNRLFGKTDFDSEAHRRKGHVYILSHPDVTAAIQKMLDY